MYFKFFKRQYWDKRAAEDRRRNCAVLPYNGRNQYTLFLAACKWKNKSRYAERICFYFWMQLEIKPSP